MFCDLVGSTGLAAQLDAEDWRDLVSEYLNQASAAVAGFGGCSKAILVAMACATYVLSASGRSPEAKAFPNMVSIGVELCPPIGVQN